MPIRLLKTKNKIVYISRQTNTESLDFKLLREEIEKQNPEIQNVVLTMKIEDGIINKLKYCINIIKQMYHISTSKIVILDTYCITACVLKHKKETKIIQIWHAISAVKKFGYQSINTPSGSSEITAKIMCMHKNYDYVLAPSKETAKHFCEAFNVTQDKIKYLGMPRIDYILKDDENIKEKIYSTYPQLRHTYEKTTNVNKETAVNLNIENTDLNVGVKLKEREKKNILYVPTFRKGEKVELDDLVEKIDTQKYNLIIKLHPLDLKDYKYKEKDGVIYEKKIKTYDLLKIADKVITDYSSLAMEAAILNLPIYFYTYDIEKYKNDPGLNFDFEHEEIGKYQATTARELLNLMEEEYDYNILEKFKEKYISIDTKNNTKKLAEFIMRLINNEEIKNMGNEPSKKEYSVQKDS